MGSGGIDYVTADNDGRRVYVPRGGNTFVFDLDSHKYIGTVTNVGGHGVVVDAASHHGFASGQKIGMFDAGTLEKIKDIDVAAADAFAGAVHGQGFNSQPPVAEHHAD